MPKRVPLGSSTKNVLVQRRRRQTSIGSSAAQLDLQVLRLTAPRLQHRGAYRCCKLSFAMLH
jgi:hypothetical protein